jgi:hypothetical protein
VTVLLVFVLLILIYRSPIFWAIPRCSTRFWCAPSWFRRS